MSTTLFLLRILALFSFGACAPQAVLPETSAEKETVRIQSKEAASDQQARFIKNYFQHDLFQQIKASNRPIVRSTLNSLTYLLLSGLVDTMDKYKSHSYLLRDLYKDATVRSFVFERLERDYDESLEDVKDVLAVHNKLFLPEGFTPSISHFQDDVLLKRFRTEAEHVDYNNGTALAEKVNFWYDSKFDGYKPRPISAWKLAIDSPLLLNAFTFKLSWLSDLDEIKEIDGNKWLRSTDFYYYAEEKGYKAIKIPMSDKITLIISSAVDSVSLTHLAEKLEWPKYPVEVALLLPKNIFAVTNYVLDPLHEFGPQYHLCESLSESTQLPPVINRVIERYVIDIDVENKVPNLPDESIPEDESMPIEFKVSAPFTFLLQNDRNNDILLYGKQGVGCHGNSPGQSQWFLVRRALERISPVKSEGVEAGEAAKEKEDEKITPVKSEGIKAEEAAKEKITPVKSEGIKAEEAAKEKITPVKSERKEIVKKAESKLSRVKSQPSEKIGKRAGSKSKTEKKIRKRS